jgi:hypothetical protein
MCKNVSFNDTVAYTGIERHQDWTFDERSSVWYTIAEYRSFAIEEHRQKKEVVRVVPSNMKVKLKECTVLVEFDV